MAESNDPGGEQPRRVKRHRARERARRDPAPSADPVGAHDDRTGRGESVASEPKSAARRAASAGERGLRGLVGAGPSQVGVEGALRVRDVNRPTDADIAEAEAGIVIVRRHWKPPRT